VRKPDSTPTRRLLRLKPASEYLSISPGALRGLCQRGEIPVIRLNDGERVPWLLDVRDLDGWVERSKATL
jgi:hypothetical protein